MDKSSEMTSIGTPKGSNAARAAAEILSQVRAPMVADYLKKELRLINCVLHGPRLLFPLEPQGRFMAGPAVTIQFAPIQQPDLSTKPDKLLPQIRQITFPGAIIVVATEGAPYAFWGGNCTAQARALAAVGLVLDGPIRDLADMRQSGLNCFATGATPDSFVGHYHAVGVNVPITCAGAKVREGDFIVGDEDGVVVIPQEVLSKVVQNVADIRRAEAGLAAGVQRGSTG